MLVHEGESLEHLEHHVPDGILREQLVSMVISLLHHLVEVLLHIFKHKVKSVILTDNLEKIANEICNVKYHFILTFLYYLFQLHHVGMG